jgi:hypothetical protein
VAASHALPVAPVTNPAAQLVHSPPFPHWVTLVPGVQVPPLAAEQQPPLHPEYLAPPQLMTHCPVVVSHALFGGQSLACRQGPPVSTTGASSPASGTGSSATSKVASGGASSPASWSVESMTEYVSGNAGASYAT